MAEALWRDVRVAMRRLRAARVVSVIAIVSLAAGIGANTTVFTLVQAVEFPSLIYPEASRLVFLESRNMVRGPSGMPVSAPDAADIARSAQTLATIGLAAEQRSILRIGDAARRVAGRRVSASFFETLRVPAAIGRVLTAADQPGAIVLSDRLWRSLFAADPAIAGRVVALDGGTVEVAGVMPPRFDVDAEFWTPLPPGMTSLARGDRQWTVFARLRDGTSFAEAAADLATISARLAADHPATNRDWTIYPVRIARLHGRESRQSFLLLQAAVGCLLLIACANIANLLLARGGERQYDAALRVSLGATRAAVVRSMLTEALLLAAAGGAAGMAVSFWGVRVARWLGGFPAALDPQVNLLVLGFCTTVSLVTGVLCGVVPAWRAASVSPERVLRETGAGRSTARGRLRAGLLVAQIAAAFVLATSAALMAQTVMHRHRVDLGFDPGNAVRAELALPWDRYRDVETGRLAVQRLLDEIARQPDIAAAGAVTWALPVAAGGQRPLTLPAAADAPLAPAIRRTIEAATPGYFAAMGVTLRAGRLFTGADRADAPPVAIVNEELARHLWPDRSPIGERLRLGSASGLDPVVTIVGVAATVRRSAMQAVPLARVYVPYAQHPNRTVTLVVRPQADPGTAARAIAAALRAIDPAALAEDVRTVAADLAQFTAPIRLMTILLGGFGLCAVLLAGLGVFGTMSCTVLQQRRELAVRAALGASRGDLLRFVYGRALLVSGIGVVLGGAGATIATRSLRAYLHGVGPTDAVTYVLTGTFLLLVALGACYRPARLAATVDPVATLRG